MRKNNPQHSERDTHYATGVDVNECSPFLSGGMAREPVRPTIPKGTAFGNLRIGRHLGSGALGSVYAGRDLSEDTTVAVKIATASLAQKRLRHEVSVREHLGECRNVVRVMEVRNMQWRGQSLLLMAMEYGDGGTMRKWLDVLRPSQRDWRDMAIRGFMDLCKAVGDLHRRGVFHLDLKPDNVIFVNGRLKLSDLGAARIASSCKRVEAIGTSVYMSPEHGAASGDRLPDARSDIFSLGVMLHEMLCRDGSFSVGPDGEAVIDAVGIPDRWRVLWPVIARCTREDPAQRYQETDELVNAIAGAFVPAESIQDIWKNARSCFRQAQLDRAGDLCRVLLKRQPRAPEALAMLRDIERRFHQASDLYETIQRRMGRSPLRELLELLSSATRLYPDHPAGLAIRTQLVSQARTFRHQVELAVQRVKAGQPTAARAFLYRAEQADPAMRALANASRSICSPLIRSRKARSVRRREPS